MDYISWIHSKVGHENIILRFFYPEEASKLFNQQYQNILEDASQQKLGVFH